MCFTTLAFYSRFFTPLGKSNVLLKEAYKGRFLKMKKERILVFSKNRNRSLQTLNKEEFFGILRSSKHLQNSNRTLLATARQLGGCLTQPSMTPCLFLRTTLRSCCTSLKVICHLSGVLYLFWMWIQNCYESYFR